jgi:NAD(P)-dependent dehydrogenase (short-subunit alcohol dehydrogenase family)
VESFFANKIVVVAGATGVLGELTARHLRDMGADVRLLARDRERVATDLADLPFAAADVSRRDDVATALASLASGDALHGIVNCTGVVAFGAAGELSEEVARQVFAVNALGVTNLLAVASTALGTGGFFASFTGVAADMTVLGMGAYCASKAAAKSTLAVAAREWRSKKISVLDVRAPHTETGLVTRALEGRAPTMPTGLDPLLVVKRVLEAFAAGERDLPAEAFTAN